MIAEVSEFGLKKQKLFLYIVFASHLVVYSKKMSLLKLEHYFYNLPIFII